MRRPVALALAALLASCAPARPIPTPVDPVFDGTREKADVAWLADPARAGRGVGTPGIDEAAAWIEARMKALKLAPAIAGGSRPPGPGPDARTPEGWITESLALFREIGDRPGSAVIRYKRVNEAK